MLPDVDRLCRSDEPTVVDKATCLLANVLYYHEGNRRAFAVHDDGRAVQHLIHLLASGGVSRWETRSHAARALGALAYNDQLSIKLGEMGAVEAATSVLKELQNGVGPEAESKTAGIATAAQLSNRNKHSQRSTALTSSKNNNQNRHRPESDEEQDPVRAGGIGALRHAVFALGNLGVMDANKLLLLRAGTVNELVRLTVHPDEELQKGVQHVLKILGDLNDTAEHEAKREQIKVDALVETIRSDQVSTTQRGAAVEMLLEQSVTDGLSAMQDKLVEIGGIDALLNMVKHCRREGDAPALTKALWALRTSVLGNDGLMHDLQSRGGLLLLLDLICNGVPAAATRTHDIDDEGDIDGDLVIQNDADAAAEAQEAALACTLAALIGNPHNCRVMLSLGIDQLIELAGRDDTPEHNRKLVFDILQVLGPYSYIECSNCGKRQPKGGVCSQCGFAVSIALAAPPP